ncbi:5-carboxymethyl-2-hydroxymuconate Delta-isomerase [Tateyamaria omphalii]|uniref:5-carboxymethyl-2-hydroxymuconate Delta-isomerase n=1 Tax=Tateyamaria omphalii TaxID=299262 RepID=UPI001C9941D7|nr:5-carboxymethyl-2-hydroxymuconate Delta-isomerase [Tateyamaria omphalii]MBY5931797.1 5-carboxymethyl-2-hydroxymuconate Delta-isomerase [Tateyamaria omphalii]
MPHIILDYSANLDDMLDMRAFCVALKDAAAATGVFPPAGIRVRAHAAPYSVVADGDPRHSYVDITVRLAAGRSDAQKTLATDAIFDAAKAFTADHMNKHPFMLSLELREIDPDHSRKTSSIRSYLPPEMH